VPSRVRRPRLVAPPSAYKSYGVKLPMSGPDDRPATCAEVDCGPYLNGWKTPLAVLTGDTWSWLKAQGYRWTVERLTDTTGYAVFPPGQSCFKASEHRRPIADPVYTVTRGAQGQWAGPPRVHKRAADWVEDFGEHQQRLADRINRG
jgi:hypothetical protein